jgi:hypothetical protein
MSSDMVIVFQHGDEARQAFPLGKPGGNISIAWGEPTRRAAIWKVVASPNGDVYVMERKTGSYLKASLHQSKVWRYAWVEPAVASSPMVQSFVEMTGDRIIDRWDRPQALCGRHTDDRLHDLHHRGRYPRRQGRPSRDEQGRVAAAASGG